MDKHFVIVVTEVTYEDDKQTSVVKRYEQIVDTIDLAKLTAFVNQKARKPREKKPKA